MSDDAWAARLDNPMLVQWEDASEERLATRNAIDRELLTEGESAEEVAFAAVAEAAPARVLDVGCGTGEIGLRIARENGLEAVVGDGQQLPFADGELDCVLAAWPIYHVADRRPARRRHRGGGQPERGVGAARCSWERDVTFDRFNGEGQLEEAFARVERRDGDSVVTFPDPAAVGRFAAAQMTRARLAANAPPFERPFRANAHHTVFVAEKAG